MRGRKKDPQREILDLPHAIHVERRNVDEMID
jgi:hypothetical protein